MIDLFKIKEDFSFMVKEAEPWTLTQFVMWLDLKLSEFKTKGYMILDHNVKTKPKWLEEERLDAELAPPPAPCQKCHSSKSSIRDVGQYFSDMHASQPVHQQSTGPRPQQNLSHQNSMEDSENIRGEVGIIDLSHGELRNPHARNNTNFRPTTSQNSAITHSANYRKGASQVYPKQRTHKVMSDPSQNRAKPDVIEIDASSPTEKMFATNRPEIGKTSTPIVRRAGQLLQKAKNRQALSIGTAIYTSTSSTLTPTFSSSYNSQSRTTVPSSSYNTQSRTTVPPSSFALGAPPVSSTGFPLSSGIDQQSLDEFIAQTVQSVTSSPLEKQTSDKAVQRQTSFHDTSSTIQPQSQTIFPGMSISPTAYQSMGEGQAIPVALHANIDNINLSTSQNSGLPTSSTLDVKMETEVNTSTGDSFSAEPLPTSVLDTSTNSSLTQSFQDTSQGALSQSFQETSQASLSQSFQDTSQGSLDPAGVPRPGLVDPEIAKAYQMVELVSGSGVYVFDKTISQAFKVGLERDTGTYSGEKMARYLLNVFWSRKDLVGATLSKTGRGKKILNQQIIEAILDFCSSHSRHTRSKVKTALHWSVSARTCQAKRKNLKLSQFLT